MCMFVVLLPIEGFFLKANFARTIGPPVEQRAVLIWQNVISDVLVRVKTVHNDWKSVQCPNRDRSATLCAGCDRRGNLSLLIQQAQLAEKSHLTRSN